MRLLLILVILLPKIGYASDSSMTNQLINQLEGGVCYFEAYTGSADYDDKMTFSQVCEKRKIGLLERIGVNVNLRHTEANCKLWAATCIRYNKDVSAVPALVKALSENADLQTCDGVIGIRTAIVVALGSLGDKSAIEPLKQYINSSPYQKLSPSGAGCIAKPESLDPAQIAIRKLSLNAAAPTQ